MTDDELQNLQDYLMGIFNIRNGLHEFDEEIIIDEIIHNTESFK